MYRRLRKPRKADHDEQKPHSRAAEPATEALEMADPTHLSPGNALALQRMLGNRGVQQLRRQVAGDVTDGGVPAVAGVPPVADAAPNQEFEDFIRSRFIEFGDRFDLDYMPTGDTSPTVRPISGRVEIVLRMHIQFDDMTPARARQPPYDTYVFSPEQVADFAWKDDEKANFLSSMQRSVHEGWSGKHRMVCTSPGFEELSAGVDVKLEFAEDPGSAHFKVNALKVPRGAPSPRSGVNPGNTANFDSRDTEQGRFTQLSEQVKSFDLGSAALTTATTDLRPQIDAIATRLQGMPRPLNEDGSPGVHQVDLIGHASSSGPNDFNQELSQQRAKSVMDYLSTKMGSDAMIVARGVGEDGANNSADFRRVDVTANESQFDVVAHEVGHMFGLGDEYVDTQPPYNRPQGAHPSHFGDIEAELGTDKADDLLVGNTNSIMSEGTVVAPGHYVYFLKQLESATGKQWTVR
ncbi:MAG: OmpA family protein [Chloroflexi bacterium]|nr:OmpA family protein [Chloroflexota bacterium]